MSWRLPFENLSICHLLQIFPSLLWLCGIGGSFLSCALVCGFAIGIINEWNTITQLGFTLATIQLIQGVAFLCVPETRGMDLEQLETIYKKKPQVAKTVRFLINCCLFNQIKFDETLCSFRMLLLTAGPRAQMTRIRMIRTPRPASCHLQQNRTLLYLLTCI